MKMYLPGLLALALSAAPLRAVDQPAPRPAVGACHGSLQIEIRALDQITFVP